MGFYDKYTFDFTYSVTFSSRRPKMTVPSPASIKAGVTEISGASISLAAKLNIGENHIMVPLPSGANYASRVEGRLKYKAVAGEKIFMNGYQTWTYCPEYGPKDKITGLHGLPGAGIAHFGLNRYGDYHFVNYPNKSGVTHGESWCYFRYGERFLLIASLDERPGYTVFTYNSGKGELTISRDCDGVRQNGQLRAFDLFIAEGTEKEVFDAWFNALGIKPRTDKRICGYSSWYNRYEDISSASIKADLDACRGVLRKGDLFQIDDGWEPTVGDWLEPDTEKFPEGMKNAADAIHAEGYMAGLWLAPFVCTRKSDIYKNHKDWLLMIDGEPWRNGCNWGDFFSLDIDNPQVVDYLERSFDRVLNQWGYDFVKLDFLYGAAPFGTDSESRAGRMYRAMEMLRRVCGNKLILGCGVPLMPAFGKVDYCRVSCDVGLDWNDNFVMQHIHRERVSTKQAIENSVFRRQLNGRAWLSDPDVFFLRDSNLKLTPEQKNILATACALLGGVFLTSDSMEEYDTDKKAQYDFYRSLTETEIIRVNADGDNIKLVYKAGTEEKTLEIKG